MKEIKGIERFIISLTFLIGFITLITVIGYCCKKT